MGMSEYYKIPMADIRLYASSLYNGVELEDLSLEDIQAFTKMFVKAAKADLPLLLGGNR